MYTIILKFKSRKLCTLQATYTLAAVRAAFFSFSGRHGNKSRGWTVQDLIFGTFKECLSLFFNVQTGSGAYSAFDSLRAGSLLLGVKPMGIVYKQILINAKLQIGKRRHLNGGSPSKRRKSALDFSVIEEEEKDDEGDRA